MALGVSWGGSVAVGGGGEGAEGFLPGLLEEGGAPPRWSLPGGTGQAWGLTGPGGRWCLPTVTFCPGCRAPLTPLGSQVAGTNLCPEG